MCTCALHTHVHTLRTDELTSGLGGRRTSVCAGRHVLPGRPTSSYIRITQNGRAPSSFPQRDRGNGRPSIPACHSKPIISPLTASCEKNHLHPVHMGSKQFHKKHSRSPRKWQVSALPPAAFPLSCRPSFLFPLPQEPNKCIYLFSM